MATSRVAERLDAPRNKISGLTGVPPLRRFFNHPTDVPLREIIEARDILIVDANMGAIGTENSKACMLFILRMLHAQLQRQVHLPEAERPRVPLLVDEAHYVASGENVVDQIATHRAAGLEAAFGLQYFAQLGSASEHQQKILKGVLNLLQSRFLFRMGDAQDAEQATRIAMAVYATMIRDDPDSRARLRVTPEQALNFPNYYCLASWIAQRHSGAELHGPDLPATRRRRRMGRRATSLPKTSASARTPSSSSQRSQPTQSRRTTSGAGQTERRATTRRQSTHRKASMPPTNANSEPTAAQPAKHEVQVDYEPPSEDAVGSRRQPGQAPRRTPAVPGGDREGGGRRSRAPPSDTLRELTFLDRINEIAPADQLEGASGLPRLYDEDYAILALLDRVGLAPPSLIGRAALPGRATRSVNDRLIKLYRHGLIARHNTGLRERTRTDGKAPRALLAHAPRAPSRPGTHASACDLSQARVAGDRAAARRPARARPARARLGDRVPPDCRRTRHRPLAHPPLRHRPLPSPPSRLRATSPPNHDRDIKVPDGQAIIDLELKTFTEIKPDLSLELRSEQLKLTCDLLVEIDLTERPSYNRDKFLAYDAFLCGWALAHPRYRAQGTRPAVVFVSPNQPRRARLRARGRRAHDRADRGHGRPR